MHKIKINFEIQLDSKYWDFLHLKIITRKIKFYIV